MERRFLECRAEGRNIIGAPMEYGDVAQLARGRETFAPGAFGDVSALDVRMNIQHDRKRLIARTGGGGLTLTDSPERLAITAEMPPIRDADDALTMVRQGILRGLSIEFDPIRESHQGDLRTIEQADLSAIGLVDIPAYKQSIPMVRQDGEGLAGELPYDTDAVIADSGRRRKQRIKPGAFSFALREPDREINVVLGSPERPLASKQGGTLQLFDTLSALSFRIPRLPRTSYSLDFLELLRTGSIVAGLIPFFLVPPPDVVPDAEGEEEEEGNPGVFRHIVYAATLTALAIMFRPPRGNPGRVFARGEGYEDYEDHQEPSGLILPKRRNLWL